MLTDYVYNACSDAKGYLKSKSALMIFDQYATLKYQYGNRKFWARGYYISMVELTEKTIAKSIREQEKDDIVLDKFSVKERSSILGWRL